jgi:hypothetical protein
VAHLLQQHILISRPDFDEKLRASPGEFIVKTPFWAVRSPGLYKVHREWLKP